MSEAIGTSLFLDANLQAYYRLENANDSKNANTLTNNGTVAFATAKYNNGADFGTTNSTKSLTRATNLTVDGTDITLAGWFKQNANASEACMVQQVSTTSKIYYAIFQNWTGTANLLGFNRARVGTANDIVTFSVNLGTTAFHHLALTYTSSTVTAYVDGVSVGTISSSGSGVSTTTSGISIGAYNPNASISEWWSGIADDVLFFSRALTATEISLLYNAGGGLLGVL